MLFRSGGPNDVFFGLIQNTPIRYGWSASELDEAAVKAEIARRTKLTLHTHHSGFHYAITRDQNGKVSFNRDKSAFEVDE